MRCMLKVVRLNAVTYPVEQQEIDELASADAGLVPIEGTTPEEIGAAVADCDALIVIAAKVTAPIVRGLERCRTIARAGAGVDNIAVEAATERGIIVSNVPDYGTCEVAEHTLALLLAAARQLPEMMRAMHAGRWSARHDPRVHRLAGRVLGLLGFGAIARAVAARAGAFELRLLAHDPRGDRQAAERHGVELVGFERLLRESDFLSIHVPLTAQTRHLIDAAALAQMKPSAILINAARGAIVDEAALVEALRGRRLGAAALDVFETIDVFSLDGPPPPHPLLDLDNVILTPHSAGSSVEATRDSKVRAARHVAQVLTGRWPDFVVNTGVRPWFDLPGAGGAPESS